MKRFPICLILFLLSGGIFSQDSTVGNKIYITNGFYFMPFVEGRIATVKIDSIESKSPSNQLTPFVLPLGVDQQIDDEIKYCIVQNGIFSLSTKKKNSGYFAKPHHVFAYIDSLLSVDDERVKSGISAYNRTYHKLNNLLLSTWTQIFLDYGECIFLTDFRRKSFHSHSYGIIFFENQTRKDAARISRYLCPST